MGMLHWCLADASFSLSRWHAHHYNVWNNVMATFWSYDVELEIRLHQSMCIYMKNIPAKFHPNPIWNNEEWDFLKRLPQQEEEEQEQDE